MWNLKEQVAADKISLSFLMRIMKNHSSHPFPGIPILTDETIRTALMRGYFIRCYTGTTFVGHYQEPIFEVISGEEIDDKGLVSFRHILVGSEHLQITHFHTFQLFEKEIGLSFALAGWGYYLTDDSYDKACQEILDHDITNQIVAIMSSSFYEDTGLSLN
jgi:hypothetical protein